MSLYDTGVRPIIDNYLLEEAAKVREYGNYWSASSAGYCYRRLIFERLKVPYVTEDARKQRVFSSGHVFHEWIQKITKDAGISIIQEIELQDEDLMIRGHVDDLVLINDNDKFNEDMDSAEWMSTKMQKSLILYDYKTAHSKWFEYAKSRPVSYYNKMQVGTYMYMVRNQPKGALAKFAEDLGYDQRLVEEARILKISKDDLRLFEYQVLWTEALGVEVFGYWTALNRFWEEYQISGVLPDCTCHKHENGFLAKEQWNPYFYEGEPCSEAYFRLKVTEGAK